MLQEERDPTPQSAPDPRGRKKKKSELRLNEANSEFMTIVQPHNYIASTETVPADSLTWSTVGLAKFVTLGSLAGGQRLWAT